MSKALNATGRPILYSLCNWGEDYPFNWGPTIANSWRISGDVYDNWDTYDARCPCEGDQAWDCRLPGFHCSVTNIMNKVSFIVSKAQPGGWNDLDALEVGNGAMSDPEYVAHFSLWAAVKSPLILGNDVRVFPAPDFAIVSNPAVIAINQDPTGQSAARRWLYPTADGPIQLWSGSLNSTTGNEADWVVLLINGGNNATVLNATLADIFVDNGPSGTSLQASQSWEVRDLWANRMSDATAASILNGTYVQGNGTALYNATETSYKEGLLALDERLLGSVTTTVAPQGTITATVDGHGAAMFRLRAVATGLARKRDEL